MSETIDRADVEHPGQGPDDGRASTATGIALTVLGVVALIASFALIVERVRLLIDPSYVPSCSLNPVLSCGSVMTSWQASLFGFPNPLIGLMSFAVVVTIGVLAAARVSLPRWIWGGLAIGTLLGAIFVHWLIFQSLYRIGALCPYCMVVWACVMPILVIACDRALLAGSDNQFFYWIRQWRWSLLTLWYVAVVILALARFWDYWSSLLP
ncbi:vitamin K epoxide reductase family protein [Millisia brevis]|uniref:vitamin K epoxide reductase family protein n=1 Tax=Millisia brevis TaxID=264148 RepID=UPI000A017C5F|nr:vitamin K epoxide reductase family protein [Millisia brevis]